MTTQRIPFDPNRPRVIILGFDGMSPALVERWMNEGYLPTFKKLAEEGTFRRLRTTTPPFSPTAWSSLATSANPGKHGIVDLLLRDPQRYLPMPSWLEIELDIDPEGKRPPIPMLRNAWKTPTFWEVALQHGVSSTALHIPVGYPIRPTPGGLFTAGWGVPDTRGSLSDFVGYRSSLPEGVHHSTSETGGGKLVGIRVHGDVAESEVWIARHPLTQQEVPTPIRFHVDRVGGRVTVEVQGKRQTAAVGEWSDWLEVQAPVPPLPDMWGIFRFAVVSIEPELWVGVGSINVHPSRPFMPISYPPEFTASLVQDVGLFRTLGVGQDYEAWLGGDMPEEFLLADIYDEWRKQEEVTDFIFRQYPANLNVCIYTETDALSHFFFWLDDEQHPLYDPQKAARFSDAMLRGYQYADGVLARTLEKHVDENTTLLVLSDHTFASFRRTVNLNTWLTQNGFMRAKLAANQSFHDIGTGKPFFRHVRWGETKAYSLGLGIYLNLKDRESLGIVDPGEEAEQVRAAIRAALPQAVDPKTGARPIRGVFDARDLYSGPHAAKGPDLILGLEEGYRLSWQSTLGGVEAEMFNDSLQRWGADHMNLHPDLNPGIFFSNRKLNVESPSIMDLGVTALEILGVPALAEMDGHSLLR
jgi:predicted AlkP superfamily phosphohydrolase/phosphomutase